MEIVPVWDLNTFDIDEVDRSDHSMDGVLIVKILIKFAVSTFVFPVASPEIDAFFHMVKAWAFPWREFF
jgi:hypothetical protein